jgi:DNA invertase Pin-like site-specific DNA recombinase
MIKGYARVSTDGQELATQHELLKEDWRKAGVQREASQASKPIGCVSEMPGFARAWRRDARDDA